MRALALVLAVLLPFNALADGLKHVPAWKLIDGRACYEFADAKKLVLLDADYEKLFQTDLLNTQKFTELDAVIAGLNVSLAAKSHAITIMQEDEKTLNAKLLEATQRANKAEANQMPDPGWLVAVAVVLAAAGVVGGVLIGKATK